MRLTQTPRPVKLQSWIFGGATVEHLDGITGSVVFDVRVVGDNDCPKGVLAESPLCGCITQATLKICTWHVGVRETLEAHGIFSFVNFNIALISPVAREEPVESSNSDVNTVGFGFAFFVCEISFFIGA